MYLEDLGGFDGSVVKNLPAMQEMCVQSLGKEDIEKNGNPLQYYCLENPTDRGAWWATVHEVTKSWTQLSDWAQHSTSPDSPSA